MYLTRRISTLLPEPASSVRASINSRSTSSEVTCQHCNLKMDVVNFNVELTDLATTFNLNKICRLCMGKDMNLLPLFGHDDSLSEKIMNLSPRLKDTLHFRPIGGDRLSYVVIIPPPLNCWLYSDDGLPSQICSLCVNQVNTSYNFKLQCETSDITLRRLLDFQVQSENCETFTIKEESDVSTTVKVGNTNLDDRSNQESD
ncbi:hypothetical protein C0J52_22324 [Blattella germanica]|nr:hypothetical protein C0J52_22324 [Blattella germanica]